MHIYYVSSVMHAQDFAELFRGRQNIPGQQAQKYHRLFMEGLAANDVPVTAVSSVPITPASYPGRVYRGGIKQRDGIRWHYLPVLNLPVLKKLMQLAGAFWQVLTAPDKKHMAVVCDVLNATVSCGAIAAARLCGVPCAGIVTDLPELMVTGSSERYSKMVRRNIARCTHYVLLTEQMNAVVNPGGKPYTIIEGLCDAGMQQVDSAAAERQPKTCLYAGLLDARYGVKKMTEAFVQAAVPGAELHLYGSGSYAEELSAFAAAHPEVHYHGTVLNEEVVRAELGVSLLVNPRPTDEEFTKYSFPSKNMEYMASGTAVLTTDLPGMPAEYREHVYLFGDESPAGMADTFRDLLQRPKKELLEKGEAAKRFVMQHKTNVVQARRLMTLLREHG